MPPSAYMMLAFPITFSAKCAHFSRQWWVRRFPCG